MTDKEKLLADVLGEDELCASTLREGLAALRQRRRRRRAARVLLGVLPLAVGAAALIFLRPPPRESEPPPIAAVRTPHTVAGTTIRVLTDEELLAFFKGRPVALIGPPGHQQLVLFDEPQP